MAATLGELTALGVGACLLLEWGVAAAAGAVGVVERLTALIAVAAQPTSQFDGQEAGLA